MKNEESNQSSMIGSAIIGLVLFFFVMGVIVGYSIKTQDKDCVRIHDTETISTSKG